MTRLKPSRQILTLRGIVQHGKSVLQKIVSVLYAQILSTPFCSLFSLNTQLKILLSSVSQYIHYLHHIVKLSTKDVTRKCSAKKCS